MKLTEAAIEIRVSIDYVRKAVKRLAVASAVLTQAGDVETNGWQNDEEHNINTTEK